MIQASILGYVCVHLAVQCQYNRVLSCDCHCSGAIVGKRICWCVSATSKPAQSVIAPSYLVLMGLHNVQGDLCWFHLCTRVAHMQVWCEWWADYLVCSNSNHPRLPAKACRPPADHWGIQHFRQVHMKFLHCQHLQSLLWCQHYFMGCSYLCTSPICFYLQAIPHILHCQHFS